MPKGRPKGISVNNAGARRILTTKELKEIDRARLMAGLEPLKVGMLSCLKCGKVFESENMKLNRLCSNCCVSSGRYDSM